MRVERLESLAWRLRASLLWLVVIGIAGVAIVLAFERHWHDYWQLIPWATLGLILLALVAVVLFPSGGTKKVVQLVIAITVIVSCVGMWQHFDENYEDAPQDADYAAKWEDMGLVERIWKVASGSVGHVPVYAAAALIPISLALGMATIGLGQEESFGDDVDPRRRR